MRFGSYTLFAVLLILLSAPFVLGQNSINGIVFGPDRRPVASITVELLDDLERLARSTETNGTGLFMFNNIRAGVYYVRIRVSGTPFLKAQERLQIGSTNINQNGNITGSESRQLNFYLLVENQKRTRLPNEVVYAQDVPQRAKILFDEGVALVRKGENDLAASKFEAALTEFSNYFLASIELGKIYFDRNDFKNAALQYEKARQINPRSFAAFWGLALSREKLGQRQLAITALDNAIAINRESVESHLLRGVILRELQKNNEALKSMLEAKRIGKNEYPDVHWNLGLLYYYNFGDPGLAADELELFISAIPKKERRTRKAKIEEVKQLIAMMRKQEK